MAQQSQLQRDIQKSLRSLADKRIAEHSQKFFKTAPGEYGAGDIFLGIRVPIIRKQVKLFIEAPLTDAQNLIYSKYHEERLFSLIFMVQRYKKTTLSERNQIFDFYINHIEYINNWDLVDTSASHIVGAHLTDKNKKILYQFCDSENIWKRRIAIIATFDWIKLNQFKHSLAISKRLLNDREDLIHKAVGWMLREIGKKDLTTEEKFLNEFYHVMPRTMLRYAIEKFPEKKRKAYLTGKKNNFEKMELARGVEPPTG